MSLLRNNPKIKNSTAARAKSERPIKFEDTLRNDNITSLQSKKVQISQKNVPKQFNNATTSSLRRVVSQKCIKPTIEQEESKATFKQEYTHEEVHTELESLSTHIESEIPSDTMNQGSIAADAQDQRLMNNKTEVVKEENIEDKDNSTSVKDESESVSTKVYESEESRSSVEREKQAEEPIDLDFDQDKMDVEFERKKVEEKRAEEESNANSTHNSEKNQILVTEESPKESLKKEETSIIEKDLQDNQNDHHIIDDESNLKTDEIVTKNIPADKEEVASHQSSGVKKIELTDIMEESNERSTHSSKSKSKEAVESVKPLKSALKSRKRKSQDVEGSASSGGLLDERGSLKKAIQNDDSNKSEKQSPRERIQVKLSLSSKKSSSQKKKVTIRPNESSQVLDKSYDFCNLTRDLMNMDQE